MQQEDCWIFLVTGFAVEKLDSINVNSPIKNLPGYVAMHCNT